MKPHIVTETLWGFAFILAIAATIGLLVIPG